VDVTVYLAPDWRVAAKANFPSRKHYAPNHRVLLGQMVEAGQVEGLALEPGRRN
jgi:hypothetical protein